MTHDLPTVPRTRYVAPPTGDYPARIDDIEVVKGRWGPQLQFSLNLGRLRLEGDDYAGNRTLRDWTPITNSAGSKLARRAAAAGCDPGEGDLVVADLIGKYVTVVVVTTTDDDGKPRAKIDSWKPIGTKRPDIIDDQAPPDDTPGDDLPF